MEEAQRLRDLHFKTKARWSKAVDESDMPIKQYHTV